MMLTSSKRSDPSATPRVRWVDSPCPLCHHATHDVLLESADATPAHGSAKIYAVVQCRNCQLAYTNPRPDPESIIQYYPADYQPHRRPRKMRLARRRSWLARMTGRGTPERNGDLPWPSVGRLLDFGCGGGSYLARMASRGWSVVGLDASVGAVRESTAGGFPALVGSLPHPQLAPGTFDVVTMWHSLEHVHDPQAILAEAYQLLVPNGKLIVACPNIDSLAFRWFGPDWFGLDLPRHLTHFTPTTLRQMLSSSGFAVDRIRFIRHSDWLRSSARLAARRGNGGAGHALRWKPIAKMVASIAYLTGDSDCMLAVATRAG
jgi:SAM-dependent methyltransferase